MKKQIVFACVSFALVLMLSFAAFAADPIFMYASEGKNKGMAMTESAESYGGKYVYGTDDETYIDYTFTITEPGDYIIWARVQATDNAHNSILYQMDDQVKPFSTATPNIFDFHDEFWGIQDVLNPYRDPRDNFYNPDVHNSEDFFNIWYFMPIGYRYQDPDDEGLFYKYTADVFTLGAGEHTLRIFCRIAEPESFFDMFIVTNDFGYNPNNVGGDPKLAWLAANPPPPPPTEEAPVEEAPTEPPAAQEQTPPPVAATPQAPPTSDNTAAYVLTAVLAAAALSLSKALRRKTKA